MNLTTLAVPRAPVMYYGGKGHLKPQLLPLIPRSHVYVEPYGGAGSILFARPPSPVEVYNDLGGGIVNLMRHLQDRAAFERLQHRLLHTLYSRDEFIRALDLLADPETTANDRAWAFFVAQNQGFSGTAISAGNWSRTFISDNGAAGTTNRWAMRLSMLPRWHRRLLQVQIDNRDALEVIRYWDTPRTTFYLDPPYIGDTRAAGSRGMYAQETDDTHHRALVDLLLTIKGQAVLSGYAHPIYAPLEAAEWARVDIHTAAYAAGRSRGSGLQGKGSALAKAARIETVWLKVTAGRQGELW